MIDDEVPEVAAAPAFGRVSVGSDAEPLRVTPVVCGSKPAFGIAIFGVGCVGDVVGL